MFPGASTMNQLDKVVEVTGMPPLLLYLATCICTHVNLLVLINLVGVGGRSFAVNW